MTHLVRAELLKLRTTRMFWAYVGPAVALVPLSVALAMTSGSEPAGQPRRRPPRRSRRHRPAAWCCWCSASS